MERFRLIGRTVYTYVLPHRQANDGARAARHRPPRAERRRARARRRVIRPITRRRPRPRRRPAVGVSTGGEGPHHKQRQRLDEEVTRAHVIGS